MELPQVANNIPATVYDFSTGEQLASGRCSVKFLEHTDRLRVMRNRFEGYFRTASQDDADRLNAHLIRMISQGAPAHQMIVEYEDKRYSLTVKFELGVGTLFSFSGRAEPTIV